jgi:hypothetical protein
METLNLGSRGDTYMELYASSATNLLASDDDGGAGLASRIAGTFNVAGTYSVKVRHYSPSAYGADTNYDLQVTCGATVADVEGSHALAQAGALAAVELPVAEARQGGEVEAVVYLTGEAAGVKVETLAKPAYLDLVGVTPLQIDGDPLDESALDAATHYPDRWQVSSIEDGHTSVWYAGKGEWDGAKVPVLRFRWRLVAPLPGKVAVSFAVTVVDQSGQATTETVYGIVRPLVSEPKIDAVTPLSVYGNVDTNITIQGSDFVDTPKVYLRAGSDNLILANVLFLSDETNEVQLLQATVLAGTKPGLYKLVLENPDGGSAAFESIEVLSDEFKIYLPLSIRQN